MVDQDLSLFELETLIRAGTEADLENGRAVLRKWLIKKSGVSLAGKSTADAIASINPNPKAGGDPAKVLLRCLAVPGLVPPWNPANQLARHLVTLCEGALPDLCDFLRLDSSRQTYEKFSVLSHAHERIADLLSPLRAQYLGMESFLSSRKAIIPALNHSIIRSYGEPFRIGEVRRIIEIVYQKLDRVASLEATLSNDVADCRGIIVEGRALIRDTPTVLNIDFLLPFLQSADLTLESFLKTIQARLTTEIAIGGAGQELQKRYPLHLVGRPLQIRVPFRNAGPGTATNLRATVTSDTDQVTFDPASIFVGNVRAGDFSIAFDAVVQTPVETLGLLLEVEWNEIGDPTKKQHIFELFVLAQRPDIDWTALENSHPYSTAEALGSEFVGREEKVRDLAAKLLRNPMEPFYISGQKRVGKTSLALAAAEFAKSKSVSGNIAYERILWGRIAQDDPRKSLRKLGERAEAFIKAHVPRPEFLPIGVYDGSLSDLLNLADIALEQASAQRFVLMIDEFDEIPQELFLFGNLAEAFFANLRALTTTKNVCLVLIGGENMPFILARQGMKLNKLSKTDLDYYARDTEWEDYKLLVRQPTADVINWHNDAIDGIFEATNGNPYFTKVICASVLRSAIRERDADVTAIEVRNAIEREISNWSENSFMHLWQDGIFKPLDEREPDKLRRTKVLVAIGRCLRRGIPSTYNNIADRKNAGLLTESEIQATLTDFVRRNVLTDHGGVYSFKLPIFGLWLKDDGLNKLIADQISEDLAQTVQSEEDKARVKSEEVVALSQKWPTYRGKHIGTDEIRSWLEQVEHNKEQRLLFNLLTHLRFYNEAQIRERVRTGHSMVRPSLPEFVRRKQSDRRSDVIVTYVDGEGKSGQYYASLYAEENQISVDCIKSPANFSNSLIEHSTQNGAPAAVVIVDDIAATGKGLASNLSDFVDRNGDVLRDTGAAVFVVALLATSEADKKIREALSTMEGVRIDFRACEILAPEAHVFGGLNGIWSTQGELERAKALCTDLGVRVYPKNPLGFGDQALLIVFPTTVPNNTLPILHTHSRMTSSKRWAPLFERVVN